MLCTYDSHRCSSGKQRYSDRLRHARRLQHDCALRHDGSLRNDDDGRPRDHESRLHRKYRSLREGCSLRCTGIQGLRHWNLNDHTRRLLVGDERSHGARTRCGHVRMRHQDNIYVFIVRFGRRGCDRRRRLARRVRESAARRVR